MYLFLINPIVLSPISKFYKVVAACALPKKSYRDLRSATKVLFKKTDAFTEQPHTKFIILCL